MPWGLEYTLNKMRSHMEAPWRWDKALFALACAATPTQCIISWALGEERGYSQCDIMMTQTVVGACAIVH